jgi:acetyl-CoA decarbonylase/synthase complex subunit delta
MTEKAKDEKFLLGLLEKISQNKEVEFQDLEFNFEKLSLNLSPSILKFFNYKPDIHEDKIDQSIHFLNKVEIPENQYEGNIVEVKLGATKAEGGTRDETIVIGGEKAPAFYNFMDKTPHKPVIALDCFDWSEVPLSRVMKQPYREVLHDTAEWAKLCVDKYDADMINVHLLTIDPMIEDATPAMAVKTIEEVLEAVKVPIAIGGCGDPRKDLQVFKVIAEEMEGERLLFSSVTLDMDVEATAKIINKYGHTIIAFTPMDINKARQLNQILYNYLPPEDIIMDTTTAALGYGLDYAYSIMERARLSALNGDAPLCHPIASGSTNAWAAREAWMKMGPEFSPRELRGPLWEAITAQTLLLAGADYFMMMHPAAIQSVRIMIDQLLEINKLADVDNWLDLKK